MTVAFILMPLAGCSDDEGQNVTDDGGSESPSATVATGVTASDGTVFSGPYANSYMRAYQDTKTSLGKSILKDGTITDAEWEELKDAYVSCAADVGVEITFPGKNSAHDSNFGIVSDEQWATMHTAVEECWHDTDFYIISQIWDGTMYNPDNTDFVPDIVNCLVSHGLVEAGMTAAEYKEIMGDEQRAEDTFGKYMTSSRPDYDEAGAAQFQACQENPLS